MALTAEQQAEIQLEIDKQVFRLNAEAAADVYTKEQARDAARRAHRSYNGATPCKARDGPSCKRDIAMENDRNKPTGERGVTATDITTFSDTLITYVNN
jgi:hypothetical protein